MRRLFFVFLLLAFSSFKTSHAMSPEQARLACMSVDDPVKQAKCLELADRLEEEHSRSSAKWRLFGTTDKFTDAVDVTALTESIVAPTSRGEFRPFLSISCKGGNFVVALYSGGRVLGSSSFLMRVDNKPTENRKWSMAESFEYIYLQGASALSAFDSIISGSELLVRLEEYPGKKLDAKFLIGPGLKEIKQVLEACM